MKNQLTVVLCGLSMVLAAATFGRADMTAKDVLNDLHEANQTEIHMGQLAEQKGASEDARNYGKTLVTDHEDSDKQVVNLAAKQGITLKTASPGVTDKMEMAKLESLAGSDFDKTFAKHMIDDHKSDIAKMQSAQKAKLPEDVLQLVTNTLPTLQKHLELAQKLYGQPS
jgi:putative membrane protein